MRILLEINEQFRILDREFLELRNKLIRICRVSSLVRLDPIPVVNVTS